ncbi:MAG: hypothetical protein EXS18_02170 [Verrucomicrobiae bacterium]|nr:hypothetical protein [Verrucomicrobiae bacterium]
MRTWMSGLALIGLGALNLSMPHVWQRGRPADTSFVIRHGPSLVRHGKSLRFVGVNCFRLAEYSDRAGEIFTTFEEYGIKVVRFWAFQSHCGSSGTDFSRFDAIVAAAHKHDVLLLPVLDNHWSACTHGTKAKSPQWYSSGWQTEPIESLPYRDYLCAIGSHFQNEPHILAWQLMNEPEVYPDTAKSFSALRSFASGASRELRRVDPNHLISLGLLGIGQPATTGGKFQALHKAGAIDIVSAHDYGYINEPLPGQTWERMENSLYANLCDARSLGKPFIATESGISLSWLDGDQFRRAELFCAKLRAFFDAGGVGYILWNYEPTLETEHGFDANDPVMEVIRQIASELKNGG